MLKTSSRESSRANGTEWAPSFLVRIVGAGAVQAGKIALRLCLSLLPVAILLGGCGRDANKTAAQSEAKTAAPAATDDMQFAAFCLMATAMRVMTLRDHDTTATQAL